MVPPFPGDVLQRSAKSCSRLLLGRFGGSSLLPVLGRGATHCNPMCAGAPRSAGGGRLQSAVTRGFVLLGSGCFLEPLWDGRKHKPGSMMAWSGPQPLKSSSVSWTWPWDLAGSSVGTRARAPGALGAGCGICPRCTGCCRQGRRAHRISVAPWS